MDERAALDLVSGLVDAAGDDCAIVGDCVLTTDMLHDTTDFPDGTTRYTAGWRAVGASLSDVAAMGAEATAAVAVYGAPTFVAEDVQRFVEGCLDVCETCGAEYVGGDLDGHEEFTVATTALGTTDDPVSRSGARPGDVLCVTGELGRTAAALEFFEDDPDRANELFRFSPRVVAGRAIAPHATAMMDSSDGLARSLHQLAEASDCGFAVDYDSIPVCSALDDAVSDPTDRRQRAVHFGEDFELVFTVPETAFDAAADAAPTDLSRIGTVTETGVKMDGEPLPDRGYTH
ncbi:MAG: thiamine-phosphate kinase [Natronomonas sp.]